MVRTFSSLLSGELNLSWNGVPMRLVATALTRVPSAASPLAMVRVMVLTPPLAALGTHGYHAHCGTYTYSHYLPSMGDQAAAVMESALE